MVLLVLLTLAPALGGCACTLETRFDIEPDNIVLAVGESVTPTITVTSCGGRVVEAEKFTWTSYDPQIATVNKTTGEIVGVHAGVTEVEAEGPSNTVNLKVTIKGS